MIETIILAGGKSSRMGRDKALIPINETPMLQLVCNIAGSISDQIYIITPWQEKYQHLSLSNCQFIKESKINSGPLIAFSQGLAVVKSEWVMLLACDLPQLKVDILKTWANELENLKSECVAALVKGDKGWEPLCGFYRSSCLISLQDYIDKGGNSFQGWLNNFENLPVNYYIYTLELLDKQMLFNCNTPEDLVDNG